jgi:RNA polymerase sigma-70 factor, ECF subfamily
LQSLATTRWPSVRTSERIRETDEKLNLRAKTEPSDEALISLVCEGNNKGLSLLFGRYAQVIRAIGLRVLKDSTEADDLLQDIFVLIHRFAKTFDSSKASVQFWIVQMTYRRAISRRQ